MVNASRRRSSEERRAQAIAHAADLLREGGPTALTSVAVAERMGVSQSAVYRHIKNIDELTTLASQVVVTDLVAVLRSLLLSPSIEWQTPGAMSRMCRSLIDSMIDEAQTFATMDHWQFVDGDLGVGIRETMETGLGVVAIVLEGQYRQVVRHQAPFAAAERAAQDAHARLLYADGFAVARLARHDDSVDRDTLADVLRHRLIAGWVVYLIDMNDRLGLEFPRFNFRHDEGAESAAD